MRAGPSACSYAGDDHYGQVEPHHAVKLPPAAAQGSQQRELRLSFPRVQPAEQGNARGAGQGQGQEHNHQQAAPAGVGQRLFAPQRGFLFRYDNPPVGQSQLANSAGGGLRCGRSPAQISGRDIPRQPYLAGPAKNSPAVPVGIVHEPAQVGDDERLLSRVHGGKEFGYARDDNRQCESGHTQADAVANFGSRSVQDAGAHQCRQRRRHTAGSQARRSDAPGRPAERCRSRRAGPGHIAAGLQRIQAGPHIILNDAPALGGGQFRNDHLASPIRLSRQAVHKHHARPVAAGAAHNLQVD